MDIAILIQQLLILFIILFCGVFLYKIHLMDQELNQKLTRLLIDFTLPATILDSVMNQTGSRSYSRLAVMFAASVSMYVLLPFISDGIARLLHVPAKDKGCYLFMSTFGNTGFMGYPLISALLGSEGVLYAAIVNMIFNIACFAYGVTMMSGKKQKLSLRSFLFTLLTPGISVSILSIILYLTGFVLPTIITSPVHYIGNMTTPLAMLVVGSTLGSMDLKSVFSEFRIYPFILIRQFLVPVLLFPLLKLCIPDTFLLTIVFIMLLVPVANTSVIFSINYGNNQELATKGVFLTTLCSLVTMPLALALCL